MLLNKETCLENLDAFDRMKFDSVMNKSRVFQDMRDNGEKVFPSFPSLQRDLWAGLYKYTPEVKRFVDMPLRINKQILQSVYELPEFQGMREFTTLDHLSSSLGVLNLESAVNNVISGVLKANEEKMKAMNEAQKEAENNKLKEEMLRESLKQLQQQLKDQQQQQQSPPEQPEKEPENGTNNSEQSQEEQGQDQQSSEGQEQGESTQGGQDQVNQLQQQIKQMQKALKTQQRKSQQSNTKAEKLTDSLSQDIGKFLNSQKGKEKLSQAIKDATGSTMKDTQQIRSLIQPGSGCGSGKGQESENDIVNALAITEMLKKNPTLKKCMDIAGKMKQIAMKKKKEKIESTTAKQDVEMGNNIERLLPNELLLYANPATKNSFLKNFSEGECLQYSKTAKEKAGKGPIVCCVDKSGSMKDNLTSTEKRMEWATGVAYALFCIAQRDKRPFYLIDFTDGIEDKFMVTGSIENIQKMLNPYACGGTNFYNPLNEAMSIITKEKKLKKADIIFITDGVAYLDQLYIQNIQEQKKKTKTSIYSIQLAASGGESLKTFSDKVIQYDGSDNFTQVFEI